jgi:hypothetical protein
LLQIRFSANAVSNGYVLTALRAGYSAYQQLETEYTIKLSLSDGWFLDVFIGGTPFELDKEFLVSTLLAHGIPFDITCSRLGVEGEPIDTLFGIRRQYETDVVWHDDTQSIEQGCDPWDLDLRALKLLHLDVETERVGNEVMVYSSSHMRQLISKPNKVVLDLAHSTSADSLMRETARYLLRSNRIEVA